MMHKDNLERRSIRGKMPAYGVLGFAMMAVMELSIIADQAGWLPFLPWWQVTAWTTPICWWGYILFLDGLLYWRDGQSWIMNDRSLVALQCVLSVVFWVLFEGYNLFMPGWRYVNLPAQDWQKVGGFIVAFATIMPGLFLTARLLQSFGVFSKVQIPSRRLPKEVLWCSIMFGGACVVIPPFLPLAWDSPWWGGAWAAVWSGWVFLLDPINYFRGGQSLFGDWQEGRLGRTLRLCLAGAICGLLWESWNFFAYTKWEYTFNVTRHLNFFEMPIAGFLGFIPFAMEFFVMFHFLGLFYTKDDKLGL